MDHVQRDPNRVSFNNGVAQGGTTSPVGQTQTTEKPEVASAKAKGLAETCQKYVFTKPFTKETLGKDLETKHKVFNVFFVTAGVVLFPAMLPLSAARLTYVAHMEAKNMKKGQASINESLASCERMGIQIPADSELGKKIKKLREFDNGKHITDKPFIKLSNEVIKGLNELHEAKRNEMDQELVGLVGLCKDKGYIEDSGEGVEINEALASLLSLETKGIIEGKTEKISMAEEKAVIDELQAQMNKIPMLKAALPKAKSLDIEPLTGDQLASFKSEGNAMKDFIKCGAGFEAKEVTVGDVTQKVKVKNEQINAQTVALGLGAIYPLYDKNSKAASNDGREFAYLGSMMSDANSTLDTNDKSAEGALAQMDRILDVTIAACESNLYNQSIKADLEKDSQSQIRSIINTAKVVPELQAKSENLERLMLKHPKAPSEIQKSTEGEIKVLNENLNNIRNGSLDKDNVKKLAKQMAQDSREMYISLTKNMDPQLMLKTGALSESIVQYTNNLTNFISEDMLNAGNVEQGSIRTSQQVKNSIEFYVQVAVASIEIGDFMTAANILGVIDASHINKLIKPPEELVKLSSSCKKDISALKVLFDVDKNKANYKAALNNFKGVPIPDFTQSGKECTQVDQISEEIEINSRKFPNPKLIEVVGKILKPLADISGLESSRKNNFSGFNSVLDYQFKNDLGDVVTGDKILNGLYSRSVALTKKIETEPKPRNRIFDFSKPKTDADKDKDRQTI